MHASTFITGGLLLLGFNYAPRPKGWSLSATHFWDSPLLMRIHGLTESDRIRRGNTWEEACFRVTATPLRIEQCIARFVSDS